MGMIWEGNTPYFRKHPTQVQPLHLFGPCRRPDVGAALDVPDVPGLAPKGVPSGSAESVESGGVLAIGGNGLDWFITCLYGFTGFERHGFWRDGIKKVVYKECIFLNFEFVFRMLLPYFDVRE